MTIGNGQRQTFYFRELDTLKMIANDHNIEINGYYLEKLIWNDLVGSNEVAKTYIEALYSGELTLRDIIMRILGTFCVTPGALKKENIHFIEIIKMVIGQTVWFEPLHNYTEYRLEDRDEYLSTPYEFLTGIIDQLEFRMEIWEEYERIDKLPWEIETINSTSPILLDKSYYCEEKIAGLKAQAKTLNNAFQNSVVPGDVLDLIINNWEFFYGTASIYCLVQFCVNLAKDINDTPLIRKLICDFLRKYYSGIK